MATGKELRYKILRYLKERERSVAGVPGLGDVAQALSVPQEEVSDQLDILDDLGAIAAHRTIGGGAAPMLKPVGKMLLEDFEEEYGRTANEHEAVVEKGSDATYQWDAYIAHASEDKDSFVRPLATALGGNLRIWYDEFSLEIGDSLRRKIDEGLKKSRFGVVVLSTSFFRKEWPQKELDGLVTRERDGTKVILPVWLDVEYQDVAGYSPLLADRVAAKAKDGLSVVVEALRKVLESEKGIDLSSARAADATPVQRHDDTEVEIQITSQSRRPPEMYLEATIRHVYGPPVVPLGVTIWSPIIEGEMWQSPVVAYLEPGKDMVSRIVVQEREARPDPEVDGKGRGWPLGSAPDDLWVFFRYRTLRGQEVEVARTFGMERPSNQNLFEVKRPNSPMRRR